MMKSIHNSNNTFKLHLIFQNYCIHEYINLYLYIFRQSSITESEMNNKWRIFIIRNLLCYTKLFHLAIKRFINIDICSPRYSTMVCRMLKVNNIFSIIINK